MDCTNVVRIEKVHLHIKRLRMYSLCIMKDALLDMSRVERFALQSVYLV